MQLRRRHRLRRCLLCLAIRWQKCACRCTCSVRVDRMGRGKFLIFIDGGDQILLGRFGFGATSQHFHCILSSRMCTKEAVFFPLFFSSPTPPPFHIMLTRYMMPPLFFWLSGTGGKCHVTVAGQGVAATTAGALLCLDGDLGGGVHQIVMLC